MRLAQYSDASRRVIPSAARDLLFCPSCGKLGSPRKNLMQKLLLILALCAALPLAAQDKPESTSQANPPPTPPAKHDVPAQSRPNASTPALPDGPTHGITND